METHNFTREEVAEKRTSNPFHTHAMHPIHILKSHYADLHLFGVGMHLLNDNGQIDFFLRYGGGAFEIQYLTMLGAHSSYWVLKDFVRMIVTETGREKGREGTFLGMRAVKKKKGPGMGGGS